MRQITGLESAKLKLIRASEHIKRIGQQVAAYSGSDSHTVVTLPHGTDRISVREEPPLGISILAGEVVYQIRSALDHLAFDLVKLNHTGGPLPANWGDSCFFPLWLNIPKKPTVYNCFSHILPGISKTAFTFIEAAQPYRGGALGNHLRLLAYLSNLDKHRYLSLTKARLSTNERIATSRVGTPWLEESITAQKSTLSPPLGSMVKNPWRWSAVSLVMYRSLNRCLRSGQSTKSPSKKRYRSAWMTWSASSIEAEA